MYSTFLKREKNCLNFKCASIMLSHLDKDNLIITINNVYKQS